MIAVPITERLDASIGTIGFECHRHPHGGGCPHGGRAKRRLCHQQKDLPDARCRDRDGYSPMVAGMAFAQPRPSPATLVLVLRG
jgi:hypothetical protein